MVRVSVSVAVSPTSCGLWPDLVHVGFFVTVLVIVLVLLRWTPEAATVLTVISAAVASQSATRPMSVGDLAFGGGHR